MTLRGRPRPIIVGLVLVLTACSESTSLVDQTFVTVNSSSPVLFRGEQLELSARLWTRTSPADSIEVKNAELVWSSDDPTVASVTLKDNNTTIATGVNSGVVQIRATATGFQGSVSGTFPLRVSNPIEIDSVRPMIANYGDRVTLYGVGVNNLFFATLEGTTLPPDTFTVAAGAGGLGELSFWVPPPASSGRIVVLNPTQLVIAPESTSVVPADLYEPNEAAPRSIDVSTVPFPSFPALRFYNPALAFEEGSRDDAGGVDWYRFTGVPAGGSLTFIFTAPGSRNAQRTYLASPINNPDSVTTPGWTIGSGSYHCKDHVFEVDERPADSLIVALTNVPVGSIDLVSLFSEAGRYGLRVLDGYVTSDPSIPADRLEENDNCEFADRNFADPARRVDLTVPFSEVLTIDNPHDIDWIRFQVPGAAPQAVTFRTAGPAGVNGAKAGDIDLRVMRIPVAGSPIDIRGASENQRSDESLTVVLEPGDYYIVVTDFAGTPINYSLCAAVGTSCTMPAVSLVSAGAR